MRTVAVSSASGDQANTIAKAFTMAGWTVRGLTRSAEGAARVADVGAEPFIIADNEHQSLVNALSGCQVLVFTSPADYREGVREDLASRYAAAAQAAGINRVVVNTAGLALPEAGPNGKTLEKVCRTFMDAVPEAVVIQPTIYLDNLTSPAIAASALSKERLRYAIPADAKIAWVSHRTLGEYAVAAATRQDAAGQWYKTGGDTAFDGAGLARAVGKAVGRRLVFEPIPIPAFADELNSAFGPPAGDRLSEILLFVERHPDTMNVGTSASKALGVKPESFDEWSARQNWPDLT